MRGESWEARVELICTLFTSVIPSKERTDQDRGGINEIASDLVQPVTTTCRFRSSRHLAGRH